MIGAYGPNPSMPSWTIVPEVIATSTACRPQAAPEVGISTPWSSDHVSVPRTTLIGLIGNTQALLLGLLPDPDGGPPPEVTPLPLAAAPTTDSSLAAVRGPTVPLGALRLKACWNC